jgi:glyoxylase-like metal-dependent hydrolase (beta-lactamase superfamily II)
MRTALLALSLLACGCAANAEHAAYVVQPGHIDLDRGPDGNTVIFDAPEGLVVVDTGRHPEHAQAILDHAKKVGKPVAAIANSHWHLDHTTGNRDLLATYPQASLIATNAVEGALAGFLARGRANAAQRLADPQLSADERARTERAVAAMDDRRAMVPADPVLHDGPAVIAGRRFELHVAWLAATEADLWLVAPDEGVAVVGDLVVAPSPFFDTGCEEGWTRALAAIDAAEWTTLIPGHGAPMTRADFTRWLTAFGNWLDCAKSDKSVAACTDGWMADARGFYTEAEADSVRQLQDYYVTEVLRAPPEQRMDYCRAE